MIPCGHAVCTQGLEFGCGRQDVASCSSIDSPYLPSGLWAIFRWARSPEKTTDVICCERRLGEQYGLYAIVDMKEDR